MLSYRILSPTVYVIYNFYAKVAGVTFGNIVPVRIRVGIGSSNVIFIFKIGIFNTAKFAHFFIASMKNADFLIV